MPAQVTEPARLGVTGVCTPRTSGPALRVLAIPGIRPPGAGGLERLVLAAYLIPQIFVGRVCAGQFLGRRYVGVTIRA
jgi:hypothetical protein